MPREYDISFRVKEKQLSEAIEWVNTFGVLRNVLPSPEDNSTPARQTRRSPGGKRTVMATGNDMLAINTAIKPKFTRTHSKIKIAYGAIKENFNGAVFSRREAEEFLRKSTGDKTKKEATNRMTGMLVKGYLKKVKSG